MISPQQVQEIMTRYVELVDACDIDGILALYARDALVEDPVGSPPHVGIEAVGRFYRNGLGRANARARRTGPVSASHAGSGAVPFCVDLEWNGRACSIQVIDVMEFDAGGLICSMKAYWGEANVVGRDAP
ncbi:nuclear transport factor 2 family protein [Pseudomonas aeruginosa]|uniref:Steroid delta-isomerase n=1 Tax=Pseudomonas aeruginosa TaxID=287 RepID=A0A6A9JLJ4_PSEAI|nr:nuclear transport factor 2 family protein [Pseudomonas aeruginosa]MBG7461241.1 nuclear transport factor 2 family protein [Pseudomonas aeruginosa]MBV5796744.1 nuclear transport factor 2 family protein [Pseudomonas aeruginosa]MDG3816283.1 nuclear transport factor 2 family protein [Pseudomonas aeruginosa]MUI56794.1 steroid delta-isomerase [Pseudomonas aeruginosa]RCM88028.1 Steroid Delta-isomerase [Pseudomonas aeruginosa]